MKTTELNVLWKLVKAGENRPLTAADLALLLRVRFALQAYEADIGQKRVMAKGVLRLNPGGVGDVGARKVPFRLGDTPAAELE